jgi:Succinylglutamate desuccinylase / Aspartoacylase family
MVEEQYPIGTPGEVWTAAHKRDWLAAQVVQRSYQEDVLAALDRLQTRSGADWVVQQYGELGCDPQRYPLKAFSSSHWRSSLPSVLITGGVHGYETSGVLGAVRFLETAWQDYSDRFNLVVAPCVSPWGYETINRWNPLALDPNRSFYSDSPAEESASLMAFLGERLTQFTGHIDLHETTDTDNTEFRRALAARDGKVSDLWDIPDGFYLVGDVVRPAPQLQQAIIAAVEQVTHIAPADEQGRLIGELLEQHGVINYAARELGLCMGMTDAQWVTTTEVYPDSPRVDGENCIQAQVMAIRALLDYIDHNG